MVTGLLLLYVLFYLYMSEEMPKTVFGRQEIKVEPLRNVSTPRNVLPPKLCARARAATESFTRRRRRTLYCRMATAAKMYTGEATHIQYKPDRVTERSEPCALQFPTDKHALRTPYRPSRSRKISPLVAQS